MSDESTPAWPGKEAALAAIAGERAGLVQVVRQLTPDQMVAPLLDGGRSPKDLLAHLMYWEENMCRNVRKVGLGVAVPPMEFGDVNEDDARNALIFAKYEGWSLEQIYAASLQTYDTLWTLLNELPEEGWQRTFPDGNFLWGHIMESTAHHYREHRAEFGTLVPDAADPVWTGAAAMLAEIGAARAALDGTVARLSEEQLVAPVLDGGRSPKDVLAHLLYWEGHMCRNVREVAEGTAQPPVEFGDVEDEDERNALVFAKYAPLSSAEVLAASAAQWATTWALLSDLPEAVWLHIRPGRDYPFWAHIVSNTTDHYAEHGAQMEALLAAEAADG